MRFWLLLFVLASFAFLSSTALAESLMEYPLSNVGFQGLLASGTEVGECSEIMLQRGPAFGMSGVYTILSLHAEFKPVSEGKAKVSVYYSGSQELIAEFSPQDFINGWVRVDFSKEFKEASLKLCAQTSGSISSVEIMPDSKFGYYKAAEFVLEKKALDPSPIIGRELEVVLKATNKGSAPAFAKVSYRDIELRIAQITRGDSDFEGVIGAGESVEIRYFVKPKYAVHMDLASATLEFEDVFGDKRLIYSNRPTIYVQEPEFNINAFFTLEKQEAIPTNTPFSITLTLRNEGVNPVENAVVRLEASEGLALSQDTLDIKRLEAGESRNFTISASGIAEGSNVLGCNIEYSDYSAVNVACAPLNIEFEKQEQGILLALAVVLVIVGALIYLYIYSPEMKKKQE